MAQPGLQEAIEEAVATQTAGSPVNEHIRCALAHTSGSSGVSWSASSHTDSALRTLLKRNHVVTSAKGDSSPAQQAHADCLRYFQNHKHRMDYPRYVANGWYIGSGPVESACKTVVANRLKGGGMRWGQDGSDAVCHPPRVLVGPDRALQSCDHHRWGWEPKVKQRTACTPASLVRRAWL